MYLQWRVQSTSHGQGKEWKSTFLQTRKDYSTDISTTQKCHRYLKNIQVHSVSSSFTPWQQGCIYFEESCHSRWAMREQDSRAMPGATFFLPELWAHSSQVSHFWFTWCGLLQAAVFSWIQRSSLGKKNEYCRTDLLTHTSSSLNSAVSCWPSTKRQVSADSGISAAVVPGPKLSLFGFWVGFFPFVFQERKGWTMQGQKSSKAGVMTMCQRKVHSAFWQQGLVLSLRN